MILILILHLALSCKSQSLQALTHELPQPPASSSSTNEELIFIDQRLAMVYPIIQSFKTLITSDPFNVTSTWIGADICKYKGFYCEPPPDNESAIALASIDFNGYRLSAPTLEGFLDQLPDIALFHVNSNNFGGTISPSIAKLKYLYELDISNNAFSGPFPTAILGLDNLSVLDIRFNSFSGSVPPQLFDKDINALFINDNAFMTSLPEDIGNNANHILYLTLANNKFFGPIPRGVSRVFANLTEILLLNNMLSGCLPYELGLLKEAVVFDAGNNRLTGPLPFSLGCLEKLEVLNFAGNLLYGAVPEALCGIENVVNISLSDNYFTRIGPLCWRLMKNGVLDLNKNCIPGLPFQRSVAECAMFFAEHHRSYVCPYVTKYVHFLPCWFPRFKSLGLALSELAPSPS